MGGRFTEAQLESFYINPRRPAVRAVCPFCGGELVMGHRKDTGNISLAHDAVPDPLHPGQHVAGCEVFQQIASRNVVEFLRLLQSRGVRFEKLVG
jgi:hypothetical protein